MLQKKKNIHVVYKTYKHKINMNVLNVNQDKNNTFDDEAILISKYASTWLCKKRVYGIKAAIKAGANLIILDDGLQDISINKDVNILVSNQNQGNGNNKIIPAGPLREPVKSGIKKSSCLFFYGKKSKINEYFKKYNKNIFCGKIKIDKKNISKMHNKKVIAFAGIAHPDNFFKTLTNHGLNLIDSIPFPDHFNYKRSDINKILLKCKEQSAIPVTTYKDYVKIPDDVKKSFSVVDIHIIFNKRKFFNFINKRINFYV
ncbi:MAG: tetraacyldisaccharide 4'-kinase [Pelagibacterales bacterium]|nr:tetraacyldisaccharide 4'-kinase [Pelagibacterales bacterium]OUU63328.1 MAG: tetraacyldisaccharide 4'-kinase [Alphaproteobacteria bacterium TMED62]